MTAKVLIAEANSSIASFGKLLGSIVNGVFLEPSFL